MVQISEIKGNNRDNRTAAHTHIKGLGLKSDGTAETQAGGFVGQQQAREVSRPCTMGILASYKPGRLRTNTALAFLAILLQFAD